MQRIVWACSAVCGQSTHHRHRLPGPAQLHPSLATASGAISTYAVAEKMGDELEAGPGIAELFQRASDKLA